MTPAEPAREEDRQDLEIIGWLRARDSRGVEMLLRVHGERIKGCLHTAFRLCPDDHALDEALHDACLKLFEHGMRLDASKNLSGYFYVTARRNLLRILSKREVTMPLWDGAENDIPCPLSEGANSLSSRIARILGSLPALEREILGLDTASNFSMSAQSIADELETTVTTVYALRARTRKRLEHLLNTDTNRRDAL